jgi:hypothetical protein
MFLIDSYILFPHFFLFVFLSAAMERAVYRKQTEVEGWNTLVGLWFFSGGACILLPVRFWGETALPEAFLATMMLYIMATWYVRTDASMEKRRLATL